MVKKDQKLLDLMAVRSRSQASSNSARQVSTSPLPLPLDARSGDRLAGDSERVLCSICRWTKRGGGSGDGEGVTLTLRTPRGAGRGPGESLFLDFFASDEEDEDACFLFFGAVMRCCCLEANVQVMDIFILSCSMCYLL